MRGWSFVRCRWPRSRPTRESREISIGEQMASSRFRMNSLDYQPQMNAVDSTLEPARVNASSSHEVSRRLIRKKIAV